MTAESAAREATVHGIREAAGRAPLPAGDGVPPEGREPHVVEPLFDPAAHRFGRFFDSDAPRRQMIFADFLPLDVVALLASMGGAGKSLLIYLMSICVASGVRFLGMPVAEVGGVLSLFAEDDEHELHRRGRRIIDYLEMHGNVDRGALSERFHVASRVADTNLLTAGREGETVRTELVDRLIATARLIPDLKLICIDPVSRFRGGRANVEEDATAFVTALEVVRAETGATVLATVHVNKASMRDGSEPDQSIVRGSSALVDGVRWCATMQRLRQDDAKQYGIDPSDAARYIRLELPKSNYTIPWPGMWLRREVGGVLVPAHLERKADTKAEDQYADVLLRISNLLRSHGPLTRTRIESDFAGTTGLLAAGQKTVRAVIMRAIEEGVLELQDNPGKGGGSVVNLPGGTP